MGGLDSLKSELANLKTRQEALVTSAESQYAKVAAAVEQAVADASAREGTSTATRQDPQDAMTDDIPDAGASIRAAVKALQDAVSADLKAVVPPLSRYGKLVDAHAGADLPAVVGSRAPLDRATLDRAVSNYLFRSGMFEVAHQFCDDACIGMAKADIQPFEKLHSLLHSFREGQLDPVIAWARENRKALAADDGPGEAARMVRQAAAAAAAAAAVTAAMAAAEAEVEAAAADRREAEEREEMVPVDGRMGSNGDVGDSATGGDGEDAVMTDATAGRAGVEGASRVASEEGARQAGEDLAVEFDGMLGDGGAAGIGRGQNVGASAGGGAEAAARAHGDMGAGGRVSGRDGGAGHGSDVPVPMMTSSTSETSGSESSTRTASDTEPASAEVQQMTDSRREGVSEAGPLPSRKRRKKRKGSATSRLEFSLHRLAYLDRLQKGNRKGALDYMRSSLVSFVGDYLPEVQKLMTCLLYAPDLSQSPYKALVNATERQAVERLLCTEYCRVMGMSVESPLMQVVRCGKAALPVLHKASRVSPNWREGDEADSLPVAVDIGRDCQHHSVFTCPVSREETTDGLNGPMILPCGHVLSRQSINRLPRGNNPRFKCPYCPSEQLPADCKPVRF